MKNRDKITIRDTFDDVFALTDAMPRDQETGEPATDALPESADPTQGGTISYAVNVLGMSVDAAWDFVTGM